MLIGFGVLIWLPACVTHPHEMNNWVENALNLALAGTAWIVGDFLAERKVIPSRWAFGHAQVAERKV